MVLIIIQFILIVCSFNWVFTMHMKRGCNMNQKMFTQLQFNDVDAFMWTTHCVIQEKRWAILSIMLLCRTEEKYFIHAEHAISEKKILQMFRSSVILIEKNSQLIPFAWRHGMSCLLLLKNFGSWTWFGYHKIITNFQNDWFWSEWTEIQEHIQVQWKFL